MLELTCPHCGNVMQIEERYAGHRGRCKECGGRVFVSEDGTVQPFSDEPAPIEQPKPTLLPAVAPVRVGDARPLPPQRNQTQQTYTVQCPFCQGIATLYPAHGGQEIACPHCNKSFEAPPPPAQVARGNQSQVLKGCLIAGGVTLGLMVLIGFIGAMVDGPSRRSPETRPRVPVPQVPTQSSPRPQRPAPRATPKSKITMAEFNRIQIGMTYKQVVQIIGSNGTLTSENYIPGVPGVMAPIHTKMFAWEGSGIGNAMVIFQNDRVFQRSQFGLS